MKKKISHFGPVSGTEMLWHPLVLKGAWMRVEDWYRSGNLAPEPELSRWRLHPEAELRELRSALREGTWRPSRWPQVPYPKKGACLRHYVLPTVRDQVAFMAYLVILGPLLDHRVPNFVFGNRWNRSVAWDRRHSKPQWVLRPYQLLTSSAYLPYARSHSLFRRVAHWTVARMTGAQIEHDDYGGYVQHPDDYGSNALPPWTRKEWWAPGGGDDARVYWASVDIELAYPSIRLSRLRDALANMLEDPLPVANLTKLYGGYPRAILEDLANQNEIKRVASGLMDALERVEIDPNSIPIDAWRPTHSLGDLPREEGAPGLPTGLAVSGMLLNVALQPTDLWMCRYLRDHRHGAFVRFADEFIILAQSDRRLFDLMEVVWQSLSEDANARLARAEAETKSNLHLNLSKIEPRSVQEIVFCFLNDQGWKKCKQSQQCRHLCPPSAPAGSASFAEWWNARGRRNDSAFAQMSAALTRSSVRPGEVGPFVTTLVTRMSEIGRDTLAERFGEGARERLSRLHELARFDIDDVQVRSDTRRTFAANRLVRAWLPQESSRRDLADIRESVAEVLRKTPWKFSLWHAVVRAAARRPEQAASENDRAAADWLSRQLRFVAHAPNARRFEAWMKTWPEKDDSEEHDRDPAWRVLYLSFHRTAFWHALAAVLRSLWRHGDEAMRAVAGYAGSAPGRWTVRAIPEGMHVNVRQHLAALDRWVAVLYPPEQVPDLTKWHWELDQLTAAVLASASRHDLAVAWCRAESPGDELKVPAGPLWDGIPRTIRLLERFGRVSRHSGEHDLALSTLAHLWLGGQDHRLGHILFPRDSPALIAEAQDDPARTVAAGISLGCSENISAKLASELVPAPERAGEVLRADGLALWEYHRARRILLGQPGGRAAMKEASLHRLLWGVLAETVPLHEWPIRPWEIPAVGLPARVATYLFRSAISRRPPAGWGVASGPLTWTLGSGAELLATGRRHQLELASGEPTGVASEKPEVRRSLDWDVAPHAAYYRPLLAAPPCEIHDKSYALYCDVLLLITAIDGEESILDAVVEHGTGKVPFEDRWGKLDKWSWRSRIHLPKDAWRLIEQTLQWAENPIADIRQTATSLALALQQWTPDKLIFDDFVRERVDILLDARDDDEGARTVRAPDSPDTELPPELMLQTGHLNEKLVVRIGQVKDWTPESRVVANFPAMEPGSVGPIMEQVANAFSSRNYSSPDHKPDLVILPEVSIPQPEVLTLRDLVARTGLAALAGLYWRELKPVYRATYGTAPVRKWFVNEAELVVPLGHHDRGPPTVRWYRVRKPLPAHIETGLAQSLTAQSPGTTWSILRGYRWYRFVHRRWGDFTISICADLIDTAPWRSMRGELLHLFMVAFNKDVDLYDSLTWVRAYETYVNLVAVNHGHHGGSFLWTPRRSHGNELARLRGEGLFVVADVTIPVKDLLDAQRDGVRDAISTAACEWAGTQHQRSEFKSPPPGFRRRALLIV